VVGRDEEQCRIDRFITIQIRVCLLRCTCSIPAVCLRSRKVGLNRLDLSESAVSSVYYLGERLSIGLISEIIANDRWCGLVGRGLLA
jgi:hypothetical protein